MQPYERNERPKISENAHGPYKVVKVFKNVTVRIKRGSYEEKFLLGGCGLAV